MSWRRIGCVVGLLVMVAVQAAATVVAADIRDSLPQDGAVIDELPERIELWSDEPVDPAFAQVFVLAPSGARIDSGVLEIDPDDASHLITSISRQGRAGHYSVILLAGEPNTARERSSSFGFDLTTDAGCESADAGPGCLDALPEFAGEEEGSLPGGERITVSLSSENAGPVDISVTLTDEQGEPVESARIWVRAIHLGMDHGEFPHEAVHVDDGVYQAEYVGLGMGGTWRVAVDVVLAEGDAPTTVAVPIEMQSPG